MKVQVRDGFVVRYIVRVDLGDGKFDAQEMALYAGQKADLPIEIVDQHLHKLEPVDKAAGDYFATKVLPTAPATQLGITPESLAMVKALAAEMAAQILAVQASAQAPAAA